METIHVRQRLRPSRYAFIVGQEDLNGALQAVSLNTILWGGIYNPILPLRPEEERDGLLKAFDPDFLVNLTGTDLPPELADQYRWHIVGPEDVVETDDITGRRRLGFGFNILPIIQNIHEREVRFVAGPTRAVVVQPERARNWPEFVAFVCGSFGWLPAIDIDFERAFKDGLRAEEAQLPNLTPPPGGYLPLDLTGYGLQLLDRPANFSSHIIYIGDHRSFTDLVEFWNIRATGRIVVFVPIVAYQNFEHSIRAVATEGRYRIYQQIENHADLQKGPCVSEARFKEACDWVNTLGLGPLAMRCWRPRFGLQIEHYLGDIDVAEISAKEGEEISILQDGQMTPVKAVSPPYLEDRAPCQEFSWSVEVRIIGGYTQPEYMFSFPKEPEVEAVAQHAVIGASSRARLGCRGLVVHQGMPWSTIALSPVRTAEVFQALFRQAGLRAEPSEPGRYAEQIIKKMGSLHYDCRIFKICGVRKILDHLGSRDNKLTKGNMNDIVMKKEPDEYDQINWRKELYEDLTLSYRQNRQLDFGLIFDVLLEKRVIRPGATFECRSCFKKDWYHVSEFAEEYTCRFCFTRQPVKFGSSLEWQYKADGLFQIPDSAQGSVGVILSLWRFEEFVHRQGRYVISQKLIAEDTGKEYEIDYAYLGFNTSYELVLGEVGRFNDFTNKEVTKIAEIADRFRRKPYIAFSTLKDSYSDEEKRRIRTLVDRGYRVIALTREELDPYFLHKRFRELARPHPVSLDDLSKNTIALNVAR
ncbi:hypothetical protein A7Q09_01575 [Methylacidiphilum sp. Yel]|uniref:hypothetical protein n=1 Tax=Methylacidiphilum sp. Yel TaxID=1847730 RepID=UPI00106D48D0|nr:hypothetical protein [Methylacidiphilum sp. Yel]TFE67174.1 hypothetical protein A7Q09_01575 [Methylacidiphilum sp. Yel]